LKCEEFMVMYHTIVEKQNDCGLCGSTNVLKRVPSKINLQEKIIETQKPGSIVKEHIENTKEEIENMRENFKHGLADDE